MAETQAPPIGGRGIFISYSHKDKTYLERLQVHLEPYRRDGLYIWDDTRIVAGQRWRAEIASALQAAKVAILLVSADFLASAFIAENELPPLLESACQNGMLILTVIVGACNFAETPLAQFQAVNIPSKPISSMPKHKREEVWAHVAKLAANAILQADTPPPNQRSNFDNTQPPPSSPTPKVAWSDDDDVNAAVQQSIKHGPRETHFPYLVRPVGPLYAMNENDLRKAVEIRRRVLRMFVDEADAELAPGDTGSLTYRSYLVQVAYLRMMFSADEWLRFEKMNDTFEIMLAIGEELVPLLSQVPQTEEKCWEAEQIVAAHMRHDLAQLGTSFVSFARTEAHTPPRQ